MSGKAGRRSEADAPSRRVRPPHRLLQAVTASVVGRDRELAELSRSLDSIATRFEAILLSGPAGIGKTTLWERAVTSARERGYRVVVSRPTQVETGLAFAALNDLFGDLADGAMDQLPEPQRIALEAALLRVTAAASPQPLAVAVGVLHVVRQAAGVGPDRRWRHG